MKSVSQYFAVACLCVGPLSVASADPVAAPPQTVTTSAEPAAAPAKPAASYLTVEASGGVKTDGVGRGRISFGVINALATPKLEHTFVVRNDTKQVVVVDHLNASCNCTRAEMDDDNQGKQGDGPRTIAPGQSAKVVMAVDTTSQHGALSKIISVYSRGSEEPVATLEMTGTIQETASFSVPSLDFGELPKGTKKTIPVTVTLDGAFKKFGVLPALISTNPDVQVTLKSEKVVDGENKTTQIERQYDAVLAPKIDSGTVAGALKFGPVPVRVIDPKEGNAAFTTMIRDAAAKKEAEVQRPAGSEMPAAKAVPAGQPAVTPLAGAPLATEKTPVEATAKDASATLANVTCRYSAVVVGDFAFEPRMVLVLDAPVGKATASYVKLSAANRALIDGLKISCANPAVTTKIVASRPPGSSSPSDTLAVALGATPAAEAKTDAATADLEIKILPDTEDNIQVILNITTPGGELIMLPVVAMVSK